MNKNLGLFSLSLLLLASLLGWFAVLWGSPSFLVPILAALSAATWFVYFLLQDIKPEDFIKKYLLTILVKLLAGGIFIAALLFMDPEGAEANALFFMTGYFLFTGLEVGFLFSRLK